ncbi:MAG: M20/M25/M40 family metallo-hydrolase [Candidatus Woesebacteria bacterium]|nr:M20/M25/M40 family metallo-hydrolase [Candidatus Woesebacteria bacterium]
MKNQKTSDVVNTFLKIVQIDSPTGFEQGMSKEVKNYLDKIGLKTKIDKNGNVIAFLEGNKKLEPYMLNAHLDTVEPGRGIKPKIINGWIKSSGKTILGADNKTAVAAILETIRKIVSEKSDLQKRHPLEIVFTTSEESGNYGAAKLDYSKIKSKLGYSFDVSSVNLGDIMVSAPFYNRIDIEIIGKSGHAKDPEKAVNVLPIFAKVITKLKIGRISKYTLSNIGIVKIGEAVNSIPGNAIVVGEVRSTVEKELNVVTNEIVKKFKQEVTKSKAKVTVKITRENGGYKFEKDDEFVIKTVKVVESFGLKPKLIDSFGCADANIFAEHGIKMLSVADGSQSAHTFDERIKVSDLERLSSLIYELVNN